MECYEGLSNSVPKDGQLANAHFLVFCENNAELSKQRFCFQFIKRQVSPHTFSVLNIDMP